MPDVSMRSSSQKRPRDLNIRGLFSSALIARDLRIAVQTPAIFKTFAEIEAVVQRDARA